MKTKLLFLSLLLAAMGGSLFAQRPILIVGGVVTANVTDYNDFAVTLNANVTGVTLTSTVTPATGYQITMRFVQDATGSRTVVFGGNITTACAINSTALSVTLCRWQYTATGNTWADAGGSSTSSSPSSAYTFSVSAGTVTATPNASGLSTFTGTDVCVVFNQVTAALATVGGKLFFRNGVYSCNSMTVETINANCSSFTSDSKPLAYGMAFPTNAQPSSVQWLLEGESSSVWLGESLPSTINSAGVVFNITPTAVSSVTAGAFLNGFFSRPLNTCVLTAGFGGSPNVNNDVHFKNMTVRFPVNTRGNEAAFNSWFATNVEHENTVADFNVTYNTLATGAAPAIGTYGSFGITSTVSAAGNWQFFKNTYAVGYQYGYDFTSEHIVSEVSTAIYCRFPGIFGRSPQSIAQQHASMLLHFNDQENGAGIQFGGSMGQGSRVDMLSYAIETVNDTNWYTTTRNGLPALSEANPGYTTGLITYSFVGSGLATSPLPTPNMFTTGGARFQTVPNGQSPNFALANAADNFTRNNGPIGPDWAGQLTAQCSSQIQSNVAIGVGAGVPCLYSQQASNNDQFSRATITTVNATGLALIVRASISVATYYDYVCNSATGRLLRKRVAGTFTTLASTASNCSAGQLMEIQAIGPAIVTFINGLPDISAIDSSIASGTPGFVNGDAGDSISNWSGGSLPVMDFAAGQQRSLFAPASYRGIPAKTFVTTADYTNATTTFSNLTGVGQVSSGLSFPVAANTAYTMHCAVTWSASAATAGPQFQITGPASPTSVSINMMSAITATTTASAAATAFSSALNPVGATVTSGVNETAYIDMGLVNGVNAGTIQLQAAAQGVGTLTIRQGGSCTLQ